MSEPRNLLLAQSPFSSIISSINSWSKWYLLFCLIHVPNTRILRLKTSLHISKLNFSILSEICLFILIHIIRRTFVNTISTRYHRASYSTTRFLPQIGPVLLLWSHFSSYHNDVSGLCQVQKVFLLFLFYSVG